MIKLTKRVSRPAKLRISRAACPVLDTLEKRMMMTVTLTAAPVNVGIAAGSSATFTASAIAGVGATHHLSYQWQSSPDIHFASPTNLANGNGISGATGTSATNSATGTLTVPANTSDAGLYYRAVFTDSVDSTTANSVPAQLGVIGGAISQWIFNGTTPETIATSLSDTTLVGTPGQPSPTPNAVGTGDAPLPTLSANPYNTSTGLGDVAQTVGLFNDYSGTPVYSGADILHAQSTVQPTFNPYGWRIRSNHTVTGWSQLAPAALPGPASAQTLTDDNGEVVSPQGVLFRVNTTGYSSLTLHFDWQGGGIGDMQPQYSPDNGVTWFNAGGILQNFNKDYPGITATTKPPGYTVALEGANYPAVGQPNSPFNNPNFQLRLVAAYDPNLPQINDGNADAYSNLTVTNASHGQYATGTAGAQAQIQVIDLGGTPTHLANSPFQQQAINVTGGTYQLSYGTFATGILNWNDPPSVVQAALNAIPGLGTTYNNGTAVFNAGGVTVTPFQLTPNDVANVNNNFFQGITWNNASNASNPQMNIGFLANNLTGPSATLSVPIIVPGVAAASIDPTTGYQLGITRFIDSNAATGANGGGWSLANFSFNGFSVTNGPSILTQPANTSVIGGTTASFSATEYSEVGGVSAKWQVNNGSGWANVSTGTASSSGNTFTYSFTTTGAPTFAENGYQYRVVLTDANSNSTTSFAATLTSQAAVNPTITTQPSNISLQAGNTFSLTAAATGFPTPTVQWQQSIGSTWTNLTDNGITVVGSHTTTLSIGTLASATGTLQYRAIFTNPSNLTAATTNTAIVSLLGSETVVTQWTLAGVAKTINSAYSTNQATGVTTLAPSTGSGLLTVVGQSIPNDYANQADGASGTGAAANTYTALDPVYNQTFTYGTGNFSDVTSTSGAQNPALTENLWRPRGGVYNAAAGAPGNGFSIYAKQYTQGAQFNASTAGYTNVYVSMDVYTTTSGELDARQQYTTDGINWYNVDDHHLAWNAATTQSIGLNSSGGTIDTNPNDTLDPNDPNPPLDLNSNDFYGAAAIYDSIAITSASVTNNVATIIANNDYVVGQKVNVTGIANSSSSSDATLAALNGIFTITAASSTSFSYSVTNATVASRAQGTSAFASLGGYAIPMIFNLTGVAGVANNPLFAVRLVNAYDPSLPNVTNVLFGDQTGTGQNVSYVASSHGQYAVASSVGGPTVYPGSAGNWRFGNITFHGDLITPTWLNPGSSTYAWNAEAQTLTVTSGTATIFHDPSSTGDSPTIIASGTGNIVFNSTTNALHIGGIILSGGATASVTGTNVVVVASGGTVTFTGGSTLDVQNGGIDISGGASSISTYNTLLGSSIISSTASGTGLTTLGIGSGPSAGLTYRGAIVSSGDLLIRQTYYGDADLNGLVDGSDYSRIDNGFLLGLSGWANGDFNRDGFINGSDYTLIDNAYNQQGAQQTSQIASPFATSLIAVPTDTLAEASITLADLSEKKKSASWAALLLDGADVLLN